MGIIQKNGFWTSVINYAGAFIGFVTTIFLYPKLLTVEQVGLTQILKTASMLMAQFSILGGGNIVLRYFPLFKSGEKKFNGIFTLTFLISLTGVLISTILYLACQPVIVEYYQQESSLFVQYSLLLIPMFISIVFHSLFSAWLRSLMKIIVSAIYFDIILRLLLIIIVIIYATDVITFDTFIKLFALCYTVPAIGLFIYCLQCKILTFKFEITDQMRKYAKPAIKYGLLCVFSGLGVMLSVTIDSFMLASMVSLASVGIYGVASNVTSMFQMPYRAFLSISSPIVAEYWQKNDMKGMQAIYQKFSLNIVVIATTLFLAIWINIDALYLNILPTEYTAGKWAVFILLIGKFVDSATGLNAVILSTSKKYIWDLYFAIFLIIISIISNKLLIPSFGINGAALATTFCIILLSMLKVLIVKHFFHIQPFTKKAWMVILIGIIAGVIISIIPAFLHWTLDVVMRCFLICLLFLLPIYLLKISNEVNAMADKVFGTVFNRNLKNKP